MERKPARALLFAICTYFAIATSAQSNSRPSPRNPKTYEDDEIKIAIPEGWTIATGGHPAVSPYRLGGGIAVGSSVENATRKVLLEKDEYILALAYETEHASGVDGGRFIEMLRIPWLDPDEAWDCSGQFARIPQPADRKLMFTSLLLQTGDPKVREKCGIDKDLGEWRNEGGAGRLWASPVGLRDISQRLKGVGSFDPTATVRRKFTA